MGRLSRLSLTLTLTVCTMMAQSHQHRQDLSATLTGLREQHDLAETPLLFSGPFQQGWRKQPQEGFEPACVELRADDEALHVLAVLGDRDIGNRARGFNERTWQSGDVFEIFIQTTADTYYEFHITPENRHLFLEWTTQRYGAFRRKEATLQEAMIEDPDLLHSETHVREDESLWTVYARIPFASIHLDRMDAMAERKIAFARYDAFGDGRPPVLSATPAFPSPAYHNRSAWHPLDGPRKPKSP